MDKLSSETLYHVVVFEDDPGKPVEILPNNWIGQENPSFCFWPTKKTSKVGQMIKHPEEPDNTWMKCKIRVLTKKKEFKVTILREVKYIRKQLQDLHNEQQQMKSLINSNINVNFGGLIELPQGVQALPLNSMEEFKKMEEYLKSNDIFLIAKYVSQTGGVSIDRATRNMLQKLMTNNLACEFNWAGKRGKKFAFKNTFLQAALFEAVQRNHPTVKATDAEIIKVVMS